MTSFRQPGTVLTDRVFSRAAGPRGSGREQIEVFAREVVAAGDGAERLPWLVFLQGGPGFGAQRPVGRDAWLDRALRDFRVLLLDQRGTGRSTPATRKTLAGLRTPQEQADYLAHFRADSIVADAELIRPQVTGGEPWAVLGQSFGGFCTVSYLSFAPDGISEAFITGGLPGLDRDRRRRLPAHLSAGRGQEPRALRALPDRRGAGQAGRAGAGRRAGDAARRRAAHRRAVPVDRPAARLVVPAATRCTTCSRTRSPGPS